MWHFIISLRASGKLHDAMFARVLRAPMAFFHANPVGRVLNRFSKDMSFVDELLPMTLYDFLMTSAMSFGAVVIMAIGVPWVLIAVAPLLVWFWHLRTRYVASAREIKRVEAVTRSPVYASFTATLQGLPTLRAYGVESFFDALFAERLDDNGRAFFAFLVTSRWLGFRLDGISASLLAVLALSAAASRGVLSPALVSLSLAYALQLSGLFQWAVRQSAETETQFTSVERVLAYEKIDTEAPAIIEDARPPSGWPREGAVSFRGIEMRYRPDLDPVLVGVNVEVRAREKIGIVGRTGAGKSSLLQSLFRLVEISAGSIVIDGIDTATIGLKDLRSRISVIPQNPVIFSGTVRSNLDPFGETEDADIWRALRIVELERTIDGFDNKLDSVMAEDGGNLSVGQRQLMCLARAIIRGSSILVLDEATSNIDNDTDTLIQRTVRSEFAQCTVLVIAHRLTTIADLDRILVLDAGRVLEFDTPTALLRDRNGAFTGMVRETGAEDTIRQLVRDAERTRSSKGRRK
jgi:ABC-type multidrug transport system fused ATPase/permease subunit